MYARYLTTFAKYPSDGYCTYPMYYTRGESMYVRSLATFAEYPSDDYCIYPIYYIRGESMYAISLTTFAEYPSDGYCTCNKHWMLVKLCLVQIIITIFD